MQDAGKKDVQSITFSAVWEMGREGEGEKINIVNQVAWGDDPRVFVGINACQCEYNLQK